MKLSQAEMPDFTGIGRATWSNYENSDTEPNIDGLIRISEFFRVDIHSLILVNLEENANLIGKNSPENNGDKSIPKSIPNSIPNHGLLVAEPDTPLIKRETDLLILQQLNSLTREVSELRRKLEGQGD